MKGINRKRNELNEGVYYDGAVQVTSRRLRYSGIYQMLRDVRSVQVRILGQADPLGSRVVTTILVLVLCALLWFSIPSSKTRDTFTSIFNATVFIVLACTAILALAGLLGLPPLKPKQPRDAVYAVSIRFRLFSSIVAASTDRAYIEKIAGAIQYAMARRDNDKVGATAPESMGQGLEVPTPTVRGNTLYAGDAVYELSEARACKLSWITDRRWPSSVLLGALILQQLLNYAGRYSPDLLSWAFAGEMFIVVPVMCAYLIAGMPSSSNRVYVVRVSPIAGGEHSVFASTSKGDAMEMQRSIEQAMKGSYAVGNA